MQHIAEEQIRYAFKVVILGAPGVGKTCLFNRYCFNSFNLNTDMTIGINFHSTYLRIKYNNGIERPQDKYVVNSIFDLGGQRRFRPLIPRFLDGTSGALLVFDSTSFMSFQQLEYWYNKLIEFSGNPLIPKILVASKSDLLNKVSPAQIVNKDEIENFAKEKQLDGFLRTSALENFNVLEVFKSLTNLMLERNNSDAKVI